MINRNLELITKYQHINTRHNIHGDSFFAIQRGIQTVIGKLEYGQMVKECLFIDLNYLYGRWGNFYANGLFGELTGWYLQETYLMPRSCCESIVNQLTKLFQSHYPSLTDSLTGAFFTDEDLIGTAIAAAQFATDHDHLAVELGLGKPFIDLLLTTISKDNSNPFVSEEAESFIYPNHIAEVMIRSWQYIQQQLSCSPWVLEEYFLRFHLLPCEEPWFSMLTASSSMSTKSDSVPSNHWLLEILADTALRGHISTQELHQELITNLPDYHFTDGAGLALAHFLNQRQLIQWTSQKSADNYSFSLTPICMKIIAAVVISKTPLDLGAAGEAPASLIKWLSSLPVPIQIAMVRSHLDAAHIQSLGRVDMLCSLNLSADTLYELLQRLHGIDQAASISLAAELLDQEDHISAFSRSKLCYFIATHTQIHSAIGQKIRLMAESQPLLSRAILKAECQRTSHELRAGLQRTVESPRSYPE